MDLQAFFTSNKGTGIAMQLGRTVPRHTGYALVDLVVAMIARRRKSALCRHIRCNQSVIRGLDRDAPELDRIVRTVLIHAGHGYYEFYHRLGKGRESILEAVTFAPELADHIAHTLKEKRGTVIVAPHVGNFDLGLLAFAAHGFPIQVITYALPPGGYTLQNRIRTNAGYVVTPSSTETVRMAIQRLRNGGIIATGIDRPPPDISESKRVNFFGRPAPLSTGVTKLALSTNSTIVMINNIATGNGHYHVAVSEPIELERTGNRQHDAIHNTERLLKMAEKIILDRPDEWMMFHPVWPELL